MAKKKSTHKNWQATKNEKYGILPADMNPENKVRVWKQDVDISTYEPLEPERNPMFLNRRIYQGSSGKVYPLPFTDRISTTKTPRKWQAIFIDNEFVQVMLLPEIGGRIHAILDKTNNYDAIYRQTVIKPALVGLAGPWISGGIEFNWAQHHRPSTFMPADVEIEEHPDGSATVWMSEHEPMSRMKGMHGVCLHPSHSYVELKARLYNRTPHVQTFLWWANVATKVHELYQSFFPPDTFCVADHARRAISSYPLCTGSYYGVDYAARRKHGVPNEEQPRKFQPPPGRYHPADLSWYANIPVPTSYMCLGSRQDFFGGYDHAASAGLIHIANHHISPGKKQWTWGNHDFGYAWDRNLSDDQAPYIEIMAGVYTDNQPDFSFLMPGETKSFSQYWYPFRAIGPASAANLHAALSLRIEKNKALIGIAVTSEMKSTRAILQYKGETIWQHHGVIAPAQPVLAEVDLPKNAKDTELRLALLDEDLPRSRREVIAYQPTKPSACDIPAAATEPLPPAKVKSVDELFIIGTHLDQYRHATSSPQPYWQEALKRDPLDSRCNTALGKLCLYRGQFAEAEKYFRNAVARLTSRNSNPYDGEAYYQLGLVLRFQQRYDEAYDAFYKATWNHAWQPAGYQALAELDCRFARWELALEHLDRALTGNAKNLTARDLKVIALRKLNRNEDATAVLRQTLRLDTLDFLGRWIAGQPLQCNTQLRLDLSLDLARAGLNSEALQILAVAKPEPGSGTAPLLDYYRGYFHHQMGNTAEAKQHFAAAVMANPDYCFPARLEEILILESAIRANPTDAMAPYYLGNLFYDRQRFDDAIALWQKSVKLNPKFSIACRNLGIGHFHIHHDSKKAVAAYEKAFTAAPHDARLFFERDQLAKCLGVSPQKRLAEFECHPDLVSIRDDLTVELCSLYNLVGRHEEALAILTTRQFQPWEGGEGQAIGQYVQTHLAVGRKALEQNNPQTARNHFEQALSAPDNLGEAMHLLANQSDIHYLLGEALTAMHDTKAAKMHFTLAADFRGDFQNMSLRAYSEMTFYSAMAKQRLGRKKQATRLLYDLLKYALKLLKSDAKIDYFVTSLPSLLFFDDQVQLQRRQDLTAMFLSAQAYLGLGRHTRARQLLTQILRRDPNHPLAKQFLKLASRRVGSAHH